MALILNRHIEITAKYAGKSIFVFWNAIEVGDVITVALDLSQAKRGSNGLYSPKVLFYNLRSKESFVTQLAASVQYLNQIEYKVVDFIDLMSNG